MGISSFSFCSCLCLCFVLFVSISAVSNPESKHGVVMMSGEENMDREIKVVLLNKLRVLMGLLNSNREKRIVHRRHAHSPAPAPVPTPTSHFHHVDIHHHTPVILHGQVERKNSNISKTRRILTAILVSVGTSLLIIGVVVVMLCYRLKRLQRKRLEKIMMESYVDGGFGGSKIPNTSTSHQKVSPGVTQELFYFRSLEPIQEEDEPLQKSICGSKDESNSPKSRVESGDVAVDCPSYDEEDDEDLSFHSICNSGCSTARSSNASESNLSPRLAASSRFSETKSSFESIPMKSHSSPLHYSQNPSKDTTNDTRNDLFLSDKNTIFLPFSTPTPTNRKIPNPPPPPPLPPLQKQTAVTAHVKKASTDRKPQPCPPEILPPKFKFECTSIRPPPPPPLQPSKCGLSCIGKDGNPLPKLKPLHWDKVRAPPDRSMVWDKIKCNSFEVDEEMIESLFSYKLQNSTKPGEAKNKTSSPTKNIFEPKRVQNFTILLKAINASSDQVCDALLKGGGLWAQQLEALAKIAPTKEEQEKLDKFEGSITELEPVERFVKTILGIPYSFRRIEVMLYKETFEDEVAHLRGAFQMLEKACCELRSSSLLAKLLEAVLKTGNRMNVGTTRGGARAFKLDTLLKLADVKGTDGKTTLLHFVIKELVRSEDANTSDRNCEDYKTKGLELVSGLSTELSNVKRTAGVDLEVLLSSVRNLSSGMDNLKHLVECELPQGDRGSGFVHQMSSFSSKAETAIEELKREEDRVLLNVKGITEYFHGDVGRDEANPLRIFVVVRDFLGVLDRVCKELGSSKECRSINRVMF